MYKVIIVEDEDPIRRGLECAIPWTELDSLCLFFRLFLAK